MEVIRQQRMNFRSHDIKCIHFGVVGKKMKRMQAIMNERNCNET